MNVETALSVGKTITTKLKKVVTMRKNKKQIKEEYNAMLNMVSKGWYDSRGKVDVYICKNGHRFYTEYLDIGVASFCMKCRLCSKEQQPMLAIHKDTISKYEASRLGVEIHQWVRPTLEQTYLLPQELQRIVLYGGLILMEDIVEYCSVHGVYKKLTKALKDLWEAICYRLCKISSKK